MAKPSWPKHPDGRNKKIGEMTHEERRSVFEVAFQELKAEFERPGMQAQIARVLNTDPTGTKH